ncbi:MAG: four helix bundle protein [Candidatus Portnoybacteria bacterium]|nr:four helix bundle protein [Candidatus Portnoybacteria bacterium]MDD4983130.1 four helix bundle protein [Candidatus Portnoybacteria bacterium]
MQLNSYKDLKVWQKGLDLVIGVYALTEKFPQSEIYGLTSQMRRASVAIPSNIAEGQKRGHYKEFLQFLFIAYGSGAELKTQIEICKKLPKIKNLDYNNLELVLAEVMKMLNGLITILKKRL